MSLGMSSVKIVGANTLNSSKLISLLYNLSTLYMMNKLKNSAIRTGLIIIRTRKSTKLNLHLI